LFRKIVLDDTAMISGAVKEALGTPQLDVAIFSGGTGITPTDVTIETVSPFFEKTLPGFGEFFRRISFDRVGSAAVLSRAVAGVAKGKALFCIPGSPDAVRVAGEMLILPEAPHIVKHARE
jgi:molybdenum cofactor biosynthesis protein B